MSNLSHTLNIGMEGHLRILGYDDGIDEPIELLNKRNAIHREHASIMIASAISNRSDGTLYTMHFGTGGATVDSIGTITYSTPNTTGSADLNVPVYFEVIDDNRGAPSGNQMAVKHTSGTQYSDVEIRCVISKNEPYGQAASDTVGSSNINTNPFVFDEIALKTEFGTLITHVVFSPIEKSANRIIEVVYTIRISVDG